MGLYLLLDGKTGEPQALIDGQRLTQWRTACASALAASYLAREDASRLLIIGAGALAPFLAQAHAAVRPIRRDPDLEPHARQCREGCAALRADGLNAVVAPAISMRRSAGPTSSRRRPFRPTRWSRARCSSPARMSTWSAAFTPDDARERRRRDRRARVYVDTRAGATKEAGDIVQPLTSGVLEPDAIVADLHELARGEKPGREARTRSRCSSRSAQRSRISPPASRSTGSRRVRLLRGLLRAAALGRSGDTAETCEHTGPRTTAARRAACSLGQREPSPRERRRKRAAAASGAR